MDFKLSKVKKEKSLPYMRSKLFATLFSTVITTIVNIVRESKGIVYMAFHKIWISIDGDKSNELYIVIKNMGSVFARCIDVFLSVTIIFIFVYTIIRTIQKWTYTKRIKQNREYLKRLLWENIIPNIIEISKIEKELIIDKAIFSPDDEPGLITLAAIIELHEQNIYMINEEGIFEDCNNTKIGKYYSKYLQEIDFPLVCIIFKEEEALLVKICETLKNYSVNKSEDEYEMLLTKYGEICKKYHGIIQRINTNKQTT